MAGILKPDTRSSRHKVVRDITSPRLLLFKFALFVVLGSAAALMLVLRAPQPVTVVLLAICVWAFARAYYFCFYVVEQYVDQGARYSGIFAALRTAWSSDRRRG